MALSFEKIKGLFVVPEDETEVQKNKKTTETKKESTKEKTRNQKESSSDKNSKIEKSEIPSGSFNQQIFESLTKAISAANLPGEDYLEFIDALMAMKSINLDEKVKMQTVLATLSTKGLTVQKVIESADYYLKVLENEKDKFTQVILKQTDSKIGGNKKEIEQLEIQNKDKADMIKRLTDEINNNQKQITKIKQDIQQAEHKIKSTENNFKLTYDFVINQIKEKIKTIQSLSPNK